MGRTAQFSRMDIGAGHVKEYPLGNSGIKLEVSESEIYFNDNGVQFGLGKAEILDLYKWMQQHISIKQIVKEELVISEPTIKTERFGLNKFNHDVLGI